MIILSGVLRAWLKAFGTYMAMMSQKNSGGVSELMAYMVSIIQGEEEYEEGGCAMMWLITNRLWHVKTHPGQK